MPQRSPDDRTPARPDQNGHNTRSSSPLSRREILSAGAGAAAAGLVGVGAWRAGLFPGGGQPDEVAPPEPPTPTPVPEVTVAPTETPFPTPTPEPGSPADEMVEETSIAEIRRALDARWFTIREYVAATLDRIDAMNGRGPAINAVIEVNPDALDIADALDAELQSGALRGPLHGIPVLLKDVFATGDRMRTTAGSLALAENGVVGDAFMVEALRNAGAVIIGKTNLTEFSNFRGSIPSGWSSRGGQTLNPYVLTHTPWGSSSGSAAAVAASFVPLAIGVETDGSIICPAAACGVVAIKPTVGLVSRSGMIGISFTQDSPGAIGRSVEDVAYGLAAMVGFDPLDMAYGDFAEFAPPARVDAPPIPEAGTVEYLSALDPDALRGARIGVSRATFGFDPIADAHAELAIEAMREAGAVIIDDIYMEAAGILRDGVDEGNMFVSEFAFGVQQFLATWMPDGPITSLEEIVQFNYEHWDEVLAMGGQEGLEFALNALPVDDAAIRDLIRSNTTAARDDGIDVVMDEYDLDALVAPSSAMPTPIWAEFFSGSSTQVPSMAGYPSITIPIGYSNGLPAGLHIFGRAFTESTLLGLAYSLEQHIRIRRPPQYLAEEQWGEETPIGATGVETPLPSDGTDGGQ